MNKVERLAFWAMVAVAAATLLYLILPPAGLAVIALVAFVYVSIEIADKALRCVWRGR